MCDEKPSEPVFQHFAFPLDDFIDANPALDLGALAKIRFIFDHTPSGVAILDDVGFWSQP